ncbi:hypothetical protein GYN14_06165 [Lactococcus piscium]|uniref:hypothetical protein n=1 Tax=Pseudolactococcus carnosus TaxID=2749961 RepID=UPI001FBB0089|nr:hypothetical protein [Lactococcus carnosus]MCJ1974814.1 hypothetical protein [Lactococcus carnosus]MCJ1984836.1 hypothetical protein [Lactococcus carnosus]MCJ1992082.1 hypothetical protein [Lactococcus carnosus]
MRKLNQAEDLLNDYHTQMQQKTRQLVDYVYSFYRDIPGGFSSSLSQPFESVLDSFHHEMRNKQQDIEDCRDEARRTFSSKMDW